MKILVIEFVMRNAPLVLDGLLSLGLAGSIFLFLGAQREMQRQARRNKRALHELADQVESQSLALTRPRQDPLPEVAFPAPGAASSGPRPAFNLTKRVQALRLLRRGQDIGHVSAVLGMTRKEIELMIRVQQLSAGRSIGKMF